MRNFGLRWRWLCTPALALVAAAVLAACGGSTKTTHATATPAAAKSSNGVAIPAAPKRIVSLSPSATDDLYAIGAGRRVVAVDQFSTYPPRAPRTSLSAYQPNVEAIAKYRPDLVITYVDIHNVDALLGKLHIPVLLASRPATLTGVYGQLRKLGAVTGHPRGAAEVIARMRKRVAAVLSSVPRPHDSLTVYHELDQTYFSASSRSLVGQLYSMLGLRNIADGAAKGSPYPQLSSEYVIAKNPDLIVLADSVCCGQSEKTVAARPGWNHITAVMDHAVLPVNDSVASEWGPRVVSFLQAVADELRRLRTGP